MDILTGFSLAYLLYWFLKITFAAGFLAIGIKGVAAKYGIILRRESGLIIPCYLIILAFLIIS